jgi:F-type H+-transporting ATPase subunit gamma
MAVQAKAIKQKIKGVGNIRKITRTMEMVSVSKMKKASTAALLVRSYAMAAQRIITHIGQKQASEHVYFKTNATDKKLYIICSSNKGLCGSYNTNIYRKLSKSLASKDITKIDFLTIGKQSEKIAKRLGGKVVASFTEIGDTPDMTLAENVFSIANTTFRKEEYGSVYFVYTHFVKQMNYEPTILKLFPFSSQVLSSIALEEEPTLNVTKETVFEPSEASVLEEIVPSLVEALIFSGLTDASASEHSSRMFAMKTASDNAKEMQRLLTISYNRARQDAVTQELAEIAAGAGAVSA